MSIVAKLMYLVDEQYSPEHDTGIIYSDLQLNIDWGLDTDTIILSDKDKQLPMLKDSKLNF